MLIINNKPYLLTALISFVLGMGVMFLYTRAEINDNKNITKRIVNNCADSLITSNDLINNCSEAYKSFGACVTNLDSCNLAESASKLDQLNQEKESINLKLKDLTKDIDGILNTLHSK